MTTLEKYAEMVARDVDTDAPQDGEKGAGFMEIITTILGIVVPFLQNCPLSKTEKRTALAKPNILQRAAFRSECFRQCKDRREALTVYRGCLARASIMPDPDAVSLIEECDRGSNLLI